MLFRSDLAIAPNLNLLSPTVPQVLTLNNTAPNSFPVANEAQVTTHNATAQSVNTPLYYYLQDIPGGIPVTGWYDANINPVPDPVIGVGQGFFYANPGAATVWPRTFNPNAP